MDISATNNGMKHETHNSFEVFYGIIAAYITW